MDLNWKNIKPLNGSTDKGFEELCAQLARAEVPDGARFVRKGTPDAGVECFAVLSDGAEWGWQAKYFHSLGSSQWSQIDKSVKTALEKHPQLVRYYVCMPLDLPDARLEGKKSAKDKWEEHVGKWTKLAADKGMSVEFIFWGSHELLERLARPEHVGRVRFWFGAPGFDAAWFRARLEEALKTAGPRYTPEVHVDLPIAFEFEAFGRTERFFEAEKAHARAIREQLRSLIYFTKDVTDTTVGAALNSLKDEVQAVLNSISAIESQPTGELPFKPIAEQIRATKVDAENLLQLLEERERDFETQAKSKSDKTTSYQRNPFRDLRFHLYRLLSELDKARESFEHADRVANNTLMLLRGAAGTGKTHLLCDIARQRIAEGRPTVLLMGQRFVSDAPPWSQALQQLDLTDISAEEFVGAFEAAAQAANSRALLMIDALNEGNGRAIWPSHLAAFLARLERSPWIGVVLAVRSSYEELIIPKEIRKRAVTVTHEGFRDHEYDATKTFFIHYGLELPSTPFLVTEFQNPLFLKILCQGLNAKGEQRLPRGFQGITALFDLYFSAINERLAKLLDYDKRDPLVRRALEAFAKAMLDSGKTWLPLSKAKAIVDAFLPGRSYEQSLYRGLVTEGVLVEEARFSIEAAEEIVFIAYERFADYLAAKILVDTHLDENDPEAAFGQGGGLRFVCEEKRYVSPGLLEAICIQLPERIGRELPAVAPDCMKRWTIGDAFRQSLIWRDYEAISEETLEILNKLHRSEHDFYDTLDVLLTVAVLPGHPLNAQFLDKRLRKNAMPDRDAWWSVYLHLAWGTRGAVDRLVDWASSANPDMSIDQESVELCAITLFWMLTTSNRFLRDRATKALVSLLTGRLEATVRLVQHFSDVDDPYVLERVYAVAYGVAMRCHDPDAVGMLAQTVYDRVFAEGSPPPHILLRDYARGVVERALYLGSEIDVDPENIRPPYNSTWPEIPSEEEINRLLEEWSRDSDNYRLAQDFIVQSVRDGDFAWYVIGTNSSMFNWLAIRLDESQFEPAEGGKRYTQEFDRAQIQRYILKRVINLGWTIERFGYFDLNLVSPKGRQAAKAERIGKKYQWIAYHEIMAFISDHFQYRERFHLEDVDHTYEGPWQLHRRDIDPSCTIKSLRGGTSWEGHKPAWWGPTIYDEWGDPNRPRDWVVNGDDLPKVEDLLIVTNPSDGSRWLNCQGYFNWRQPVPADKETTEVERRELWYILTGYLIRAEDAQAFLKWAEGVDYWGRWMPEAPEVYQMFLGEYPWAPAARYFQRPYYGDAGWTQPSNGCPVKVRNIAFEYLSEAGSFDCSVDESFTLRLPVSDLITGLGIRWSGFGADFVDVSGRVVAQDPAVHAEGPTALLLQEDALRDFLEREKLTICWTVLGEKRILSPGFGGGPRYPALRMSGAYLFSEERAIGFAKYVLDDLYS